MTGPVQLLEQSCHFSMGVRGHSRIPLCLHVLLFGIAQLAASRLIAECHLPGQIKLPAAVIHIFKEDPVAFLLHLCLFPLRHVPGNPPGTDGLPAFIPHNGCGDF